MRLWVGWPAAWQGSPELAGSGFAAAKFKKIKTIKACKNELDTKKPCEIETKTKNQSLNLDARPVHPGTPDGSGLAAAKFNGDREQTTQREHNTHKRRT